MKESKSLVKEICSQLIAGKGVDSTDRQSIKARALELIKKSRPLDSSAAHEELLQEVLSNLWGFGPVESLLNDPEISEIMINGQGRVWAERAGELFLTELFLDLSDIQNLIERILAPLGLHIDRANPEVDARLPDGARVHIVVPPIAIEGPCISIRRFLKRDFKLDSFTYNSGTAEMLRWAVSARANIIVSGGTSSGKTTLLNVLGRYIQSSQRIITIEDAAELNLAAEHIVRLETRQANAEGVGKITQRDLVKSALRMRPDRILVGEVRGAEALDMIQAMNTGNEGSLSTCHANTARDSLFRLETMILMANSGLTLEAARSQIFSALDLVVHLKRTSSGQRRIAEILEVSKGSLKLLADEKELCALPEFMPRNSEAGSPKQEWLNSESQQPKSSASSYNPFSVSAKSEKSSGGLSKGYEWD